MTHVPDKTKHPLPTRNLKVEKEGDFWKGKTKPKIRLIGHWLEEAGFVAESRVEVVCISPGVIELRCSDAQVELLLSSLSR